MSAIAGIAAKALPIASKVIGALPVVGGIAKKVIGGIRGIFGGGSSQQQSQPQQQQQSQPQGGMQGMIDAGRSFMSGARGMYDAGRSIYQGFRQGGFGGGMQAFQQQIPTMGQHLGGMIDAGRSGYSIGRSMFDQGRGLAQDTMSDFRRLRRGWQGGGFGGMSPMGGY